MSARQLIILGVALLAAIGALFAIRMMNAPRPAAQQEAPVEGRQVLVASRDIGQGAALAPGDVVWRLFPSASVSPHFITQANRPEALNDIAGGVTRRPFVAGEPFTLASVVMPEGRGLFAAQLTPGYRAVAVEIEANTAAGGFIQPNDRVDVIVTQQVEVNDGNGTRREGRSSTILEDIRILALDGRTQPQAAGAEPERIDAVTAVLELTPEGARRLARGDAVGDVSLVLRPVEIGPESDRPVTAGDEGESGGVLIHSFGRLGGGG